MSSPHHEARRRLHARGRAGQRAAEAVVGAIGSWPFLIAQTILMLCWIAANGLWLARPFDPRPFIILNLLLSTQAAIAGPLILMAGNAQARRDRARDDLEADEVHRSIEELRIIRAINESQQDQDERLRLLNERQYGLIGAVHRLAQAIHEHITAHAPPSTPDHTGAPPEEVLP